MDDLIVIILTLLVVIIGALNQLKKQKQAAKQTDEKSPEPGIWETLFEEPEDAELQPVGQSAEAPVETFQLESTEPEIKNYKFGQVEEKLPYLHKRVFGSANENKEVQESETTAGSIGEDFSLRKAVIYSEILNTKYF